MNRLYEWYTIRGSDTCVMLSKGQEFPNHPNRCMFIKTVILVMTRSAPFFTGTHVSPRPLVVFVVSLPFDSTCTFHPLSNGSSVTLRPVRTVSCSHTSVSPYLRQTIATPPNPLLVRHVYSDVSLSVPEPKPLRCTSPSFDPEIETQYPLFTFF